MREPADAAVISGGLVCNVAGSLNSALLSRSCWITGALASLAFVLVFGQSIFHNDFPYEYHPDEPSKVEQVLDGRRNYNHPPLMLNLTRAALWIGHIDPRPQNIAQVGRFLSAFYMAGSAALLTLLAAMYGGPLGAAGAVTAICTNWQVILAGHFFKEDPLFTLGLAATQLSGAWVWQRRGNTWFLLLGGVAGFTLAAKYVGIVAVIYALVLTGLAVNQADKQRQRAAFGWCLAGIITFLLVCNGDAVLFHYDELRQGILTGLRMVEAGNEAVGGSFRLCREMRI